MEKDRAEGNTTTPTCLSVRTHYRQTGWKTFEGEERTPPKKRVLIKFVLKNCKSLYLLKANEALMLRRPLCLVHRTPWMEHTATVSFEMVRFGSSSSGYWDTVWGYRGPSVTNNLQLLWVQEKRRKKQNQRGFFFFPAAKKKWTVPAPGLSPQLTLASLRGVSSLNGQVIKQVVCWPAWSSSHQRSHANSITTVSCSLSDPQLLISPPSSFAKLQGPRSNTSHKPSPIFCFQI